MLITVVNEAPPDVVSTGQLLEVIRAITRQIYHDFEPYWGASARLRLATTRSQRGEPLKSTDGALAQLDPVSGGAVVRLMPWADEKLRRSSLLTSAKGFHARREGDHFPVGYVFVTDHLGTPRDDWSVTLSHEVLEVIANPHVNLRVDAPHPCPGRGGRRRVYTQREVCDPVQDGYTIDGVQVANFVLPLYFVEGGHQTERVDFMGTDGLESFGLKPGGYIPYFDPATGEEMKYGLTDDGTPVMTTADESGHYEVRKGGRGPRSGWRPVARRRHRSRSGR